MKVTICQLNDDPAVFERDWAALVEHARSEKSQLVLLPEMPFYTWFPRSRPYQPETWQAAIAAHDRWQARLSELAPAAVIGSRPAEKEGRRWNEGFLWDIENGYRAVHSKVYLPDEDGFWEASWYSRGSGGFIPFDSQEVRIGLAICTDLWFLENARAYGRQGTAILANPRGTLQETVEKWLVGGRASAIVSGAFSLSSNRVSSPGSWPVFGGQGWIVNPEGKVLGLTTTERPFITIDVDLSQAEQAKKTYPRYVQE